uniref:PPM-type phosphatase domain-containing protein n=1 Tax=Romanomermis culicivorax TaxID=13658 RepID=A0A915JE45_ROMCU
MDLNKVQQLYLSCNGFDDLIFNVIDGYRRLSILDLSYNRITSIDETSVLDVSTNHLRMQNIGFCLAPNLKHLDISCNENLIFDSKCMHNENRKLIAVVDVKTTPGDGVKYSHGSTSRWKIGFSETFGERNKLCIRRIASSMDNQTVIGLVDGGLNCEIPLILERFFVNHLRHSIDQQLKYAIMLAHLNLGAKGQKLGASCSLCRISVKSNYKIQVEIAAVGNIEIVLCRNGRAVVLTKKCLLNQWLEEYSRIRKERKIITEENEIDGITNCTRLIGCYFLNPAVIPDPCINIFDVNDDDEFFIIASKGIWQALSHEEAIRRIRFVSNPILAAKHLQDVAQSYGYKQNLSVIVVRLCHVQTGLSTKPRNVPKSLVHLSASDSLLHADDN